MKKYKYGGILFIVFLLSVTGCGNNGNSNNDA